MKKFLLALLVSFWGIALAQAPSGQEQPEPPEEETAGEAPDSAAQEEKPVQDAELESPAASGAADAVEETLPPEPPEEDDLAGDEFEPGEEISEDYPVPLPSDI